MPLRPTFRNCSIPTRERESNDSFNVSSTEFEDPPEIEQEYVQKLGSLAAQLKQIEDRTHPEFIKFSKKMDNWLEDQRNRGQILHEHKIDEIHRQYDREVRTCDHDCASEKKKIQEHLIILCEDLKRRLEHDKRNIELTTTGDVLELKPTVTRKLRRRAPEMPSLIAGSGFNMCSGGKLSYWGDLNLYNTNWTVGSTKAPGIELPPIDSSEDCHNANVIPAKTPFSNLFGSMGVDLEDGSLLNHLLASLNVSRAAGNGHMESGCLSKSSTLLAQSMLASSTASPLNSVAAAIVPGLISPVYTPPSKRKKQQNIQSQAQLNMLLPQNDIYSDLTQIHRALQGYKVSKRRACGKPPASLSSGISRKHGTESPGEGRISRGGTGPGSPNLTLGEESHGRRSRGGDPGDSGSRRSDMHHRYGAHHHLHHHHHHHEEDSSSIPRIWIDDGALFIGQNFYRQGSQVCLESHGCTGTVTAVGVQDIHVKRASDNGVVRITLQQLRLGRYVMAPLKP